MKLILTTEAKIDIKRTAHWYEKKQKDLGRRFTKIVREEIKIISDNPELYRFRYKDVHTAVIAIFPYMIHYRFDSNSNHIIILGIIHTSLSPKKWK